MRTRSLMIVAFILGFAASLTVTVFFPQGHWMGFHIMFVMAAGLITEKFLGIPVVPNHQTLTYGIAATLHGLLFAVMFGLLALFFPRLKRRVAVTTLAVVVVVDIMLLVFVSPMKDLP